MSWHSAAMPPPATMLSANWSPAAAAPGPTGMASDVHRDRRDQLHEPARRGAGDGSADPSSPGCAAHRFRRKRRMAWRPRNHPRIRGAGRGGRLLASRRAPFQRCRRARWGRCGRAGALRDPARRRQRRNHPSKIATTLRSGDRVVVETAGGVVTATPSAVPPSALPPISPTERSPHRSAQAPPLVELGRRPGSR